MRAGVRGHGLGRQLLALAEHAAAESGTTIRFWIPRPAAQPKCSTGGCWTASQRHPGLRRRPHRCAVPQHPLLQGSDLNPSWRTATRIGPSMSAIPIARQVVRAPAGCGRGQPPFPGRAGRHRRNPRPRSRQGGVVPGAAVSWPAPGTPQAVPGLAWPDTQPWRWPSLAMVPHSGHTRCAQQAGSPPSPGSPAVGAASVAGSEFRVGPRLKLLTHRRSSLPGLPQCGHAGTVTAGDRRMISWQPARCASLTMSRSTSRPPSPSASPSARPRCSWQTVSGSVAATSANGQRPSTS